MGLAVGMLGYPAFLTAAFSVSRWRTKIGVLCDESFVSFSSSSSISALPLKILLSSARRIVLEGSFRSSAFPNNCGGTDLLPDKRDSSTRRRRRCCSRSSRQACQRAWAFCKIPSFSTFPIGPFGPLAHACSPEKENRVVINRAVTSSATATRFPPHRLNPVRSPLDRSSPSNPPGSTAPRTSQTCHRESSVGSESSSMPKPATAATCEPIALLRNQRQPNTRIAAGSRNAANPKVWKRRSAPYAPAGPIHFRAGLPSDPAALTLSAASFGEYDSSASAMSTASVIHKNPISSLNRLFPFGVSKRKKISSALRGRLSVVAGCSRYSP